MLRMCENRLHHPVDPIPGKTEHGIDPPLDQTLHQLIRRGAAAGHTPSSSIRDSTERLPRTRLRQCEIVTAKTAAGIPRYKSAAGVVSRRVDPSAPARWPTQARRSFRPRHLARLASADRQPSPERATERKDLSRFLSRASGGRVHRDLLTLLDPRLAEFELNRIRGLAARHVRIPAVLPERED